jgi:hypothetical protein
MWGSPTVARSPNGLDYGVTVRTNEQSTAASVESIIAGQPTEVH